MRWFDSSPFPAYIPLYRDWMDRESSLLYEIIRLVVPKSFRPEVGSIESREIARGEGGHRGPCSHAHHTKRVSISVCMRLSSYTILWLHRCIRGLSSTTVLSPPLAFQKSLPCRCFLLPSFWSWFQGSSFDSWLFNNCQAYTEGISRYLARPKHAPSPERFLSSKPFSPPESSWILVVLFLRASSSLSLFVFISHLLESSEFLNLLIYSALLAPSSLRERNKAASRSSVHSSTL